MAEGNAGRIHIKIRNPQDFYGGIALVAFAIFALWASSDLPGMRGFAFGPGTAPRMFAILLAATGAGVALIGLLTDGPSPGKISLHAVLIVVGLVALWAVIERLCGLMPLPPFLKSNGPLVATAVVTMLAMGSFPTLERLGIRGMVLLTLSTLCFAMFIRPFGLVITSMVSIIVSAAASNEVKWLQALIWAVVLTTFCALLFPWALNLPLQLWPRF
jgi:putative tricarboxylic transport membrane protein